MTNPAHRLRAAAFLVSATAFALSSSGSNAADVVADRAGFDKNVKPFLAKYCTKCHGTEKQESKLTLHDVDPDILGGVHVERWQNALEQLELADMPPEDEKQPTDAEKQQVLMWINGELKKAGKTGDLEALRNDPAYGNRVDHAALFSGKHKGPAYSPSRIWRISPYIVNARHGGGGRLARYLRSVSQPFSLSDGEGVKDYASQYFIDGPTLELLLLNADEMVKNQLGPSQAEIEAIDKTYAEEVANNPKFDEKRKKAALRKMPGKKKLQTTVKEFREIAYGDQPPTDAQIEAAIDCQFQIALSRSPTNEELKRHTAFARESIDEGGKLEGMRAVLTAILVMPETIYRMELGLGQHTKDGRRMLSPMELAFALGYALRDTGPDKEIMADAQSGKLNNRGVIAAHVERMFMEEMHGNYRRTQSQRILRFFQEYFGYTHAPEVFKDGSRHPGYKPRPDTLVEDTNTLVRVIVKRDKDVLKELLTTDTAAVFIRQKDFRLTYKAYGVTRKEAEALVKTATSKSPETGKISVDGTKIVSGRGLFKKPGERAGILTQPSWLTAHSQNFDNDPVKRGKWIYERLLAGTIPDVPITVDASVPSDHDKTLRTRLEKTKADYCWRCHKKMNPLGMAFEMYDDVGRFRTEELLRDNKTKVPADAHSDIVASGVPGLDGKVDNAVDLMNKLAASPRVRQSFVRHAFRFWMGRNETLDDSPTLIAADKAYVDSGGSMKALIVSLITSDSFLYRK